MNDATRTDVVERLGPLRRYARSLARDDAKAEDLVQDTLVRADKRRSSFRSGGNLRDWLLSILHNTFIDHRRRCDHSLCAEGGAGIHQAMARRPSQRPSLQEVTRSRVS